MRVGGQTEVVKQELGQLDVDDDDVGDESYEKIIFVCSARVPTFISMDLSLSISLCICPHLFMFKEEATTQVGAANRSTLVIFQVTHLGDPLNFLSIYRYSRHSETRLSTTEAWLLVQPLYRSMSIQSLFFYSSIFIVVYKSICLFIIDTYLFAAFPPLPFFPSKVGIILSKLIIDLITSITNLQSMGRCINVPIEGPMQQSRL